MRCMFQVSAAVSVEKLWETLWVRACRQGASTALLQPDMELLPGRGEVCYAGCVGLVVGCCTVTADDGCLCRRPWRVLPALDRYGHPCGIVTSPAAHSMTVLRGSLEGGRPWANCQRAVLTCNCGWSWGHTPETAARPPPSTRPASGDRAPDQGLLSRLVDPSPSLLFLRSRPHKWIVQAVVARLWQY
jgi:hypothetical protein